jgi:hypothetical protein
MNYRQSKAPKLKDFYNMNLTNYNPHRGSISSVKSNIEMFSTPPKDSLENSVVDQRSHLMEVNIEPYQGDSLKNDSITSTYYNHNEDKIDEYTHSEKEIFLNKIQYLNKNFVHQEKKNTNTKETAKICYKHMQKIEISIYSNKETLSTSIDVVEKSFWFGAYDKHINLNNLLKVLQFYTEESTNKIVIFNKIDREEYLCEGL